VTCAEARRDIDLFLDGERPTVGAHLDGCPACAKVCAGEKALRAALKSRLERAPEGLAARLSRSIAEPLEFRRPVLGKLAAAVFFAALAGFLLFTPSAELPQALAAEMAARHDGHREPFGCAHLEDRTCVCAKCTPDAPKAMDAFFHDHGREDFCKHDLEKALGYRWDGVAAWPRRGSVLCWSLQRDASGRSLSHALMSTPVALGGKSAVVAVGSRVVIFVPRSATLTCVFVFDNAAEAQRFREALGIR
jgi:hypothetical protein